jgi:hypothetical protein
VLLARDIVCPSSANQLHAVVVVVDPLLQRKAVTVGPDAEAAFESVDDVDAKSPPPHATKVAAATAVRPVPSITRHPRLGASHNILFMIAPRSFTIERGAPHPAMLGSPLTC